MGITKFTQTGNPTQTKLIPFGFVWFGFFRIFSLVWFDTSLTQEGQFDLKNTPKLNQI